MQLQNPFPYTVRVLFMDAWECWICHENGTRSGGLELHHIFGRISASALNATLLCNRCHSRMGHSMEEQHSLFRKTLGFLWKIEYRLLPVDNLFLESIRYALRDFAL